MAADGVPAKWEAKRGHAMPPVTSGRGRGTTLTARQSSPNHVATGIDPRSMPSISARRRPPTTLLAPCPQPLRVSPIASRQAWPIGRAPREARIRPFSGLLSLPSARSPQSSARHDFQSQSREPSFESKLGGVGPVVAGALDRPRRLILTAAAASNAAVQKCNNIYDSVINIIT